MNIGIAGAGLLGQLLAYKLSQQGHHISIFTDSDQQASSSATCAAAGLLTPIIEMQHAEQIIYHLGMRSIELWKKILANLTKEVFYKFNGSIITAHPEDHTELVRFKQKIATRQLTHQLETLGTKHITLLGTGTQIKHGYYLPMDGHINSRSLLAALNVELDQQSINWYIKTWVTQIKPYSITTANHSYTFDMVFDCRGYKAKDAFADIRGIRGELLHVYAPEVSIQCPVRLLTPHYPIYIVPLPDNHYIIGASEIETEDQSPISVRTTLELLTAAYTIHTGFAEARIIESKVGLRPALPSHLPQIKHMPGLIALNGLYRHGFLIAPALIEDALQLIDNKHLIHFPELLMEEHYDNYCT